MKKNLLILLSVLAVVIVVVFIFIQINYNKPRNQITGNSCIDTFLNQNLEADKDYVSGEVSVGFPNNANGVDVINILKQYNFKKPSSRDITFSRHTYYIEVISGNPNDFLDELTSSGLFYQAFVRADHSYGNPSNIIFAYDNLDATDEQISNFFNSNNQLKIKSVDTHSISISVKVPKNTEYEWICKLQKDSKIEYAALNSYGYALTE